MSKAYMCGGCGYIHCVKKEPQSCNKCGYEEFGEIQAEDVEDVNGDSDEPEHDSY